MPNVTDAASVGTLADHAGLLIWDETTLAGLFQLLATLRETPDPVAVLEALVGDTSLALTGTAAPRWCLLPHRRSRVGFVDRLYEEEASLLTGGNN